MDPYQESNRQLWDEWTRIHVAGDFYDVGSFKDGTRPNRIYDFELEEVGDVSGKNLLHVQCHFGLDTLSWARLGATVTGVDFSPEAVRTARELAEAVDLPATFIESNVYELDQNLTGTFNIVYTSIGVLGWLPDVEGWAKMLARFVKPGGFLYLAEVHPVMQVLDDEAGPGEIRLKYPYWTDEVLRIPVQGSYADREAELTTAYEYGWNHSLGEVVTAIAQAGLHIEFLHEFPFVLWPVSFGEEKADRKWGLPAELDGKLPLFFSLRARKPPS